MGVSTNPGSSIGVGALTTYNFSPDTYTGPFINMNANLPVSQYGGPAMSVSMTPKGMDQWTDNGAQLNFNGITEPYTVYGGWTFGDGASLDIEAQVYFDRTDFFFGLFQ